MNNMYTKLFLQVNKLFKEDYLLKDNIPQDILNWIYHNYDIRLEGKVLQIDAIPDLNVFIIKDKNLSMDFYGTEIVLFDNKPCKVIVISKDFLEMEINDVQKLLFSIYEFILKDLYDKYKEYSNSLYLLNLTAPYILTINTMISFRLTFSYKVFKIKEDNKYLYNVLVKSCDYSIEELLDDLLILRLIGEEINK